MARKNSQTNKATSYRRPQASETRKLDPGDEAGPGTIGTGEDICPQCHGKGSIGGSQCPNCGGTGRIIEGIGGA